ncbi:MAG: hypothetical protein KC418_14975 [Anaerolineales bacterium]|nr:hypothetical protein [Anaerolineales bacterium]MCB8954533.1 hypothetical protein [Ardenticatenales bacterium]
MLAITLYAYFVSLVLFCIGWYITRDAPSRTARVFVRAGLIATYLVPSFTFYAANRVVLPAILAFFVDLLDTGLTFYHPAWMAFWWLFAFAYGMRRVGRSRSAGRLR